jgi:hypothetical protein
MKQYLYSLGSITKNYVILYKDGYLWFLLTCLWALFIPIIARMVIQCCFEKEHSFFGYLLWDGEIVLFSMVISTTLVIDNFLFENDFATILKRKTASGLLSGLVIHVIPTLMIVFCLIIYLKCQASEGKIGGFTIAIEIVLFVMVATYAAFVKHTSWEKKRNHPLS